MDFALFIHSAQYAKYRYFALQRFVYRPFLPGYLFLMQF